MPGCGKTTIGRMLSKKLNRKSIDMDEYIETKNNATIKEIFKNGEAYFRNLESKAALELSKESNVIISTGGGIVKNLDNIKNLAENGIIIFIDRPIDKIVCDLDIQKRPLLKDGVEAVYKLFDERYELYKKCSHFKIENNGTIEEIVEKIVKLSQFIPN